MTHLFPKVVALGLVSISVFPVCGQAAPREPFPVVQNLRASCRNGQVFVTWAEAPSNTHNLRVYMAAEAIRPATLDNARLLADRVQPHSANDWYEDPELCPKAKGPRRGWILDDGASPLDPTGGLFVHTVERDDPPRAYFAVLADGQDANALARGSNSLASPVALQRAPMQAIWQLRSPEAEQRRAAVGNPLAIYLHSHQGRPAGQLTYLVFGDRTMGWREGLAHKFKVSVLRDVVLVEPYDRVWINRRLGPDETYSAYNRRYKNIETWHYGTNDRIYDPKQKAKGTPTNYTERLYMWILDWVQATYQTDRQRVYAYGASMGTGVLRLVLGHPGRFALCDVLVPFVDFAYERGDESNAKRFTACCGSVDLVCSDGMPLRDRFDLVAFVARMPRDLPPVIIRLGRRDRSVYWRRKPAFIRAMQQQRQALFAGWDNGGHGDAMRRPVEAFPNFRDFRWAIQRLALDHSFPAFTHCSLDQNPGNGDPTDGDIIGFINRGLDWDAIVDEPTRYRVRILCRHPGAKWPVTVDVTPRRRQRFRPAPGAHVHARNQAGDQSMIEERTLVVDPAGRITYSGFAITSAQGNTLVLDQF